VEDAGSGITSVGRLALVFGGVAHRGAFDVFVDEPCAFERLPDSSSGETESGKCKRAY
jgi:hypothetical protein